MDLFVHTDRCIYTDTHKHKLRSARGTYYIQLWNVGPLLNTCLLLTSPTYQDCHNSTDLFIRLRASNSTLKFSGIGQLKRNFNQTYDASDPTSLKFALQTFGANIRTQELLLHGWHLFVLGIDWLASAWHGRDWIDGCSSILHDTEHLSMSMCQMTALSGIQRYLTCLEGEWIPETAIMVFVFYVSFKNEEDEVFVCPETQQTPFGSIWNVWNDRRINRVYVTSSGTCFFPWNRLNIKRPCHPHDYVTMCIALHVSEWDPFLHV